MLKGFFNPLKDFGQQLAPVLVLQLLLQGGFNLNNWTFNVVFIFVAILIDIPVTSTRSFT